MKSFYKRLNSGWRRLLHVVLSVGGALVFAILVVPDGSEFEIVGCLILGVIIYQPLAWTALWVIDGFKSENNTSELVTDQEPELVADKEQSDISTQEVVNTEENQGGMRLIVIKWLIPILIFFVLYFPLYWVFVFKAVGSVESFAQSLTPVCVLVSFGLSRYLGKLIKGKLLK